MTHSTTAANVLTEEAASKRLPNLRESLGRSGADYLYLRYEGTCGRCSVWDAALMTSEGNYCAVALPPHARQQFRELCLTLLDLRYSAWAAAEGAEGSFVWDLREDRLIHSHRTRVYRAVNERPVPLTDEPAGPEESEIPF